MSSLETDLYKALEICNGDSRYVKRFIRTYTFTTENINDYIKYFELKNKSLLTVGSSGDQILNAFFHGARDITLYDINPYAKYYVYLKISAILSLNYIEFQKFFFKHGLEECYNSKMFSKNLFNKIKPNLRLFDYESFLFYDELFSYYNGNTIRDHLFDDDESRNTIIKSFNTYLKSEWNYNKLKSIIKKINFKYINGNIFEDNITNKYDNIFLSNLCTITELNLLRNLLERLDTNNLKENGSILIGYLWDTNFNSNFYEDDWKEIYRLPLTKEILKNFITEYYQINNDKHYLWNNNENKDLVLIYRKTK